MKTLRDERSARFGKIFNGLPTIFPGMMDIDRSKEMTTANLTRIVQQVLGYTKSYAAVMRITDRDKALQAMIKEVSQATTSGDFTEAVHKRAIRAGVRLGDAPEAA